VIQSSAPPVPLNPLVNQADGTSLPQQIVSAIRSAANQTGVNFSYLLQKASQESSFDPNAKAASSSATGLYQFTRQTWLQMVKNYGGKYGLGTYADHIQIDGSGVAHVSDPTWKQAILNLRKDPVASAEMAGELDKANQASLQGNVGGKIGATELYLAHFLGAGGASDFLNEMHSNPKQAAADVLPEAAAANPNVFYAKDGTPRSLQQIYQHFAQKFDGSAPSTLIAKASPAKSAPVTTTPMTFAEAGTAIGSAMGGLPFSPSNLSTITSGLKTEGSSLFATMVLAQMNDASMPLQSDSASNQNNKKTPFDLLAASSIG
jgi:hypothetical protein